MRQHHCVCVCVSSFQALWHFSIQALSKAAGSARQAETVGRTILFSRTDILAGGKKLFKIKNKTMSEFFLAIFFPNDVR